MLLCLFRTGGESAVLRVEFAFHYTTLKCRCNELENVVKQLQADIDTLREFSEVEREFMEMQVLQERAKNDDLAKRLEFTGVIQSCCQFVI